jgi:outer membrane protein assembly factor BamB
VVDDLVVVPAGGGDPYVSLVAFDKKTGEKKWDAGDDFISYASPVVAELHGVRQIVSVNERTVSGHDIASGDVLWAFDWPGRSNTGPNVANAQVVSPDRVFVSKYYGGGGKLVEITRDDEGGFRPAELWHEKAVMETKFTNPVIHEGYIYGLSDGVLECVEVDSGDSMWKDRREGNFGHGQILLVDDLILALSEEGELALVEANPDELTILGRQQVLEGKTWNTFALCGKFLLVRNAEWAACYELTLDN